MNDRKNIALIDPVGGHGGMDYYDYGLASALGKKGVGVIYCTSEETIPQEHQNVYTHLLFTRVWSTSNKFLRLFRYIMGLRKSLKLAKLKKCELVHLQFFELSWLNLLVLMFVRSKKLRSVVTLHDIESFHLRSSKLVDRLCVKRIDSLIVHNNICKELVTEKLQMEEVSVIPHGNYIGMLPLCEERPMNDDKLDLLFFGQIKEVKGLDILIEALALLKNQALKINLTIAGKPWKTDLGKYQQMIKEHGLESSIETHFRYIPNEQVYDLYNKSDLVVLPYRRIYQSGVLLMAMSMGRPVLASDLDSFKELIEDGKNGFLFRQGDPESLAAKLKMIHENKVLLNGIRSNALKEMKEQFNWDLIASQTEKVYLRSQ